MTETHDSPRTGSPDCSRPSKGIDVDTLPPEAPLTTWLFDTARIARLDFDSPTGPVQTHEAPVGMFLNAHFSHLDASLMVTTPVEGKAKQRPLLHLTRARLVHLDGRRVSLEGIEHRPGGLALTTVSLSRERACNS